MTRTRHAVAGIAIAVAALWPFTASSSLGTSVDSVRTDDCSGTAVYSKDVPSALIALQVNGAWEHATGLGIVVAVVDSGIDANNEHLRAAVIGGVNLVGDGENPSGLTDLAGHGTAIAGEIAARQISDSGVVGLAPRAHLLSVRVFRSLDQQSIDAGFGPNPQRLAAGIRWAAEHGATIINVSLSDYTESTELADAVAYANASGSLVVASAGNTGTTDNTANTARFPAAYPGVVGVAAVDPYGIVQGSIAGAHVSVAAPGMDILTTAAGAGDCEYATEVADISTSFATGYVSAAAALVAEAHPSETPAQWKYRLEATAVRVDRDHRTDAAGWGIIQPNDAIELVPSAATRGPESPFTDTAGSAVSSGTASVKAVPSSSPLALTRLAMMYAFVAAVSVLGVLAVFIVLRRVRRDRAAR